MRGTDMAGLFDASRLYEALREVGLLPQHSNITGGRYSPDTNKMTGRSPETMAHEMTHAAQWNLLMNSARNIQEKKRNDQEVSPQEEQFLQGIQKIYGESFGTIGQRDYGTKVRQKQATETREKQIQGMYKPFKDEDYNSYRTSRRELEAFGVGSFAKGTERYVTDEQPHLNPTMAQEFDILFSLYNSLPASVKQDFAGKRKAEIEAGRKGNSGDRIMDVLDFEDLTADPFKPTIK